MSVAAGQGNPEAGTRNVALPEDLCARAEAGIAANFGGLEPMLVLILQEMLRDDSGRRDRAEEQAMEARLRDLGYL